MNAEQDREWQALENLWREQTVTAPVPEGIRQRVLRQERRMLAGALLEWLVAIALCTFALYLAVSDFTAFNLIWALIICALVAWALNFSIDNRRDLWHPAAESAQSYIDLALLRLERKRRAVRFAWILYGVELAIFALWDLLAPLGWWEPLLSEAPLHSFAWLWLAAITLALAVWSLVSLLQVRREFGILAQLRRELIL